MSDDIVTCDIGKHEPNDELEMFMPLARQDDKDVERTVAVQVCKYCGVLFVLQ